MMPTEKGPNTSLEELIKKRRGEELSNYSRQIDGYLLYLHGTTNPAFDKLKQLVSELIAYVAAEKEIPRSEVTGKDILEVKFKNEDVLMGLKRQGDEKSRQAVFQNGFYSLWKELWREYGILSDENQPVTTDEKELTFIHGDTLDFIFGALYSHEFQ